MYRVYLADDNDLFRDSLIKTIQWDRIGCKLVGSARDGNTAGREIMELLPDIVLMDIRMPGMSGLEIAALLRSEGFDGRVIIITGYSDFGYAQKSIRIGVFDYLLKPVDEHELENVIVRAGEDIEKKRESRAEDEKTEDGGGVFRRFGKTAAGFESSPSEGTERRRGGAGGDGKRCVFPDVLYLV